MRVLYNFHLHAWEEKACFHNWYHLPVADKKYRPFMYNWWSNFKAYYTKILGQQSSRSPFQTLPTCKLHTSQAQSHGRLLTPILIVYIFKVKDCLIAFFFFKFFMYELGREAVGRLRRSLSLRNPMIVCNVHPPYLFGRVWNLVLFCASY